MKNNVIKYLLGSLVFIYIGSPSIAFAFNPFNPFNPLGFPDPVGDILEKNDIPVPHKEVEKQATEATNVAINVVKKHLALLYGEENEAVFYGNYCGYGNKSNDYSVPAIDQVDQACKEHDQCWDKHGTADCMCDQTLALTASALAVNPGLPSQARGAASDIAIFFGTWCVVPGGGKVLHSVFESVPIIGTVLDPVSKVVE